MKLYEITSSYDEILNSSPEFLKLVDTEQDPVYHAEGNVWVHTTLVLDSLKQIWDDLTEYEKQICFNACVYHDIAKSYTTVKHEDGGISARGHSNKGSSQVRTILYKANVDKSTREQICSIVLNHQVPFFTFNSKSQEPPELIVRRLSVECDTRLLYYVAKSDMMGRTYHDKQSVLQDIELFKELCIEQDCFGKPYKFADNITRVKYFDSSGTIDPSYKFYREPASTVYVMVGLPGSGKNYYVDKHLSNIPSVSYDDIRKEFNIYDYTLAGSSEVARIGKERIKDLLRAKKDFVVNNTTISKQYQEAISNLIKQYGGTVIFIVVERPFCVITSANSKRSGHDIVPNHVYESMMRKWDMPLLSYAHEIIHV